MKPINHVLFMEDWEFMELTQTNLSIKRGVYLTQRKRRQNTSPAQQIVRAFALKGLHSNTFDLPEVEKY